MIRLIHCVKRADSVSPGAFREFWSNSEFSRLLDEISLMTEAVEVRRTLTLSIDLNSQLQQERNARDSFDAVVEIVWQSGEKLVQHAAKSEIQKILDRMTQLQAGFIDFEESRRFFTEY